MKSFFLLMLILTILTPPAFTKIVRHENGLLFKLIKLTESHVISFKPSELAILELSILVYHEILPRDWRLWSWCQKQILEQLWWNKALWFVKNNHETANQSALFQHKTCLWHRPRWLKFYFFPLSESQDRKEACDAANLLWVPLPGQHKVQDGCRWKT